MCVYVSYKLYTGFIYMVLNTIVASGNKSVIVIWRTRTVRPPPLRHHRVRDYLRIYLKTDLSVGV
jgi:hypothetical protein